MEIIVQTVANVFILSSMFILVSLGFAFLFNMLGILNLAHGAIYMVSAYLSYLFIVSTGIDHWLALLMVIVILAGFGLFMEKFCFRPFIGDLNRIIMVCVGVIVILQTTVNIGWGTKILGIPTFIEGTLNAGLFTVRWDRLATAIIGIVILVLITLFVKRTRWGQQMQAITQSMEGALLLGIDVRRVSAIACAVGFGLAAISGYLMGINYGLGPFMGQSMLIKILMLIMLAGVGSFEGIFIVGLILGILYSVLPIIFPGAASDAIAVGIVIVILLFRPLGFFGHEA